MPIFSSAEPNEVEITVDALAHGGGFIGKVSSGPERLIGKKTLLPLVAPGEVVRAKITKDEKRLLHAFPLQIIKTSQKRREAPCKYFTSCGGCDLQHLNITEQREEKLNLLKNTLLKQAGISAKQEIQILGADLPEFNYRKRLSLHLNKNGHLGFYKRGTSEVVDIEECLLAYPKINLSIQKARSIIGHLKNDVVGIVIEYNQDKEYLILKLSDSFNSSSLQKTIQSLINFPNFRLRQHEQNIYIQEAGNQVTCGQVSDEALDLIPAGHFSQVNDAGNKIIIDKVCALAKSQSITELYAGSGNISFPLAQQGCMVTAIEADVSLVKYGHSRAEKMGLGSKINFVESSCENYVNRNPLERLLVLDPPRSGAKVVLENIAKKGVKEIIYVSCNLPSLMRDLKILINQGFELEQTNLIDMFSQTYHMETISYLKKI